MPPGATGRPLFRIRQCKGEPATIGIHLEEPDLELVPPPETL